MREITGFFKINVLRTILEAVKDYGTWTRRNYYLCELM